jgi:hypothetical protein
MGFPIYLNRNLIKHKSCWALGIGHWGGSAVLGFPQVEQLPSLGMGHGAWGRQCGLLTLGKANAFSARHYVNAERLVEKGFPQVEQLPSRGMGYSLWRYDI